MIKSALLSFFLFLFIDTALAQTKDIIKGTVIDYETKLPIINASVYLIANKKAIHNTLTDSTGFFTIPLSIFSTYTAIRISRLNYHSLEILKKDNDSNDKGVTIYELSPKGIELKEVVIKKNKRYRDTSIIDLSKETFERSIMIEDLFSQRGLYTDENGKLYYNGKPVAEVIVNGGDFFGKNNTKIYDKLPALIADQIEIVETNIDSITNTTLLTPILRVNLKLKEKYNKGKFGSVVSGIGTTKRYISSANLYTYKDKQQISIATNINNIDINEVQMEPIINFSATGNNAVKKNAAVTYRNVFSKKLEVDFSGKIKTENRLFSVEQQREEMSISQFSKSKNISLSNSLKLEDVKLNIRYTLDSLNSFQFSQIFNYDRIRNVDTISYLIQSNGSTTISDVDKNRKIKINTVKTSFIYEKKISSKMGRLFQLNIISEQMHHDVSENSNIFEKNNHYTFLGNRNADENISTVNTMFTEPLGEQGYIKFLATFKKEVLNSSSLITDTATIDSQIFNGLISSYIQPGFVFQRTYDKISFDGTVKGTINSRSVNNKRPFSTPLLNIDYNINVNRNFNKKTHLSWNYSSVTNYPTANQLTSISNTFDLISQMQGNINLKPEVKQSSVISYDSRISDSLVVIVEAEALNYNNKFGYNLSTDSYKPQISYIDNVGKSIGAQISLSITKNFRRIGNFNYRITLNYNENPIILNSKKTLTKTSGIMQSISTNRSIMKGLSLSPTLSSSYNSSIYDISTQKILTLVYTDKIALDFLGIEINNYPIINFSTGVMTKNLTWAINSEAKKKIFKGYGLLWVKAYDIFNSYKFQSNSFGPSYTQSTTYSNLNRYFLLGCSIKFNNLK